MEPGAVQKIGVPLEGGTPIETGPFTVDVPTGSPGIPDSAGALTNPNPLNVTLPGTQEPIAPAGPPAPANEQTIEVKVDGQTMQVTLDELKAGYSRQQDYTRKTQELAQQRETLEPVREMYDYLRANQDVAQVIYQTIEQKAAAGGLQPGQPMMDPAVNRQLEQTQKDLANTQVQIEVMQFQQRYPEADTNAVMRHAVARNIPNLEDAYKSIMYDQIKEQGIAAFTEQAKAKAAGQPETHGASQPPPSQTIDIRGKTQGELWQIGQQAYGPLTR